MSGGQSAFNHLQQGKLLANRYMIQEVIGVGGMGSVYQARDLHFPNVVKLVAVKEMINQAPDRLVRETIVQNFEREANILATLNHPAIPKIFDFFSHEERSYLVEEYINGKDLEALLLEAPTFFSQEEVTGWAIEICDVLHYLHDHKPDPIIFRDMKPSNIMINQNRRVVLVDFGIAKNFRVGQKGTMIGTEGYSPPEQYRGEATPAADLYALGATMHHLLTRHDPRLEAPFSFNERPISKINPSIAPLVEAVIMQALKYNPEERFQTAQAMKEALVGAAKQSGILPHRTLQKPVPSEQTTKPLWEFRCEDEIRGSVVIEKDSLFVGSYDNNLYTIQASNGQFVSKFPTNGGIVARPIYNQGQLFFGSEDGFLYALSTRTNNSLWQYHAGGPIRSSAAMTDSHLFIGSDNGIFHAVSIDAGQPAWKFDAGFQIRSNPIVHKDLVYFGTEAGDFFCLDFRGQIKWRAQAKRAITSSPYLGEGIIFVGSQDATMYAFDARTGWVVARFRMGRGTVSSPYVNENTVYIGSADGNLYAIDSASARENWRYQMEDQVCGSPIVYKDAVYCGAADGRMYCLEAKTGRLRWRFTTGGPITSRPAILNDILYFGSSDHKVYALMI